MSTGGLAQMTYNNNNNASFMPSTFNGPAAGFGARRGPQPSALKRLSVAMPPKSSSGMLGDDGSAMGLPRTTSRSHLLAGLRTAPKSAGLMQSSQSFQQLPGSAATAQPFQPGSNTRNTGSRSSTASRGSTASQGGLPRSSTHANFGQNQYVHFTGSEQVLAPPTLQTQQEEVDPAVLEQLQLTGMFLAQRQQQLQMQLANITAAASQLQGMNMNNAVYQQQQLPMLQQQQPVEVPGQPGLYLVADPITGQYQYATAQQIQLQQQQLLQQLQQQYQTVKQRSQTMHDLAFDPAIPTFRAEISPPPMDLKSGNNSRTDTPLSNEHVEPLPPPSANAFRRGHQKKQSSTSFANLPLTDGTKSAGGLSRHSSVASNHGSGGYGPGGNRVGIHPVRQPRGPPAIEELKALPTANHEGSKNFAARRRRMALNSLVRASSIRRDASASPATSPTSDGDLSMQSEAEAPGLYRKQSPIGSEVSASRSSSWDAPGSQLHTPSSEKGNAFDMGHFVKQLPAHIKSNIQAQKANMLGGQTMIAEKRRSFNF